MEKEINFLHSFRKKATKQQKQDKLFFRIAAAACSVVVVVTLISVGVSFLYQSRVAALQKTAKDLERQILASEELEKSAVILGKKLTVLKELFDDRHDKQKALDYFTSLFGPDVVVSNIDYEANEGILSLRVDTGSIFVIEEVINLLRSGQTKQEYPSLKLSDLRRTDQGDYAVTITVTLQSNAQPAASSPRVLR